MRFDECVAVGNALKACYVGAMQHRRLSCRNGYCSLHLQALNESQ